MRVCGTRSCIVSRMFRSSFGIHCSVLASAGPGGMPLKYFVTSSFARATVMSPASERTALFGP
jgi:hypothetical protein